MISFVLILAMWPFQHKPKRAPGVILPAPEACEVQNGLYFYVADDGVFAFSSAGCEAAKQNITTARLLNQFQTSKI